MAESTAEIPAQKIVEKIIEENIEKEIQEKDQKKSQYSKQKGPIEKTRKGKKNEEGAIIPLTDEEKSAKRIEYVQKKRAAQMEMFSILAKIITQKIQEEMMDQFRCVMENRSVKRKLYFDLKEYAELIQLQYKIEEKDGKKVKIWYDSEKNYLQSAPGIRNDIHHYGNHPKGNKDWHKRVAGYECPRAFKYMQAYLFHTKGWYLLDVSDPKVGSAVKIQLWTKKPNWYGETNLWHGLDVLPKGNNYF